MFLTKFKKIIPLTLFLLNQTFCDTNIKIGSQGIGIKTNDITMCMDANGIKYEDKNEKYSTKLFKIEYDKYNNVLTKICGFKIRPNTLSYTIDGIKVEFINDFNNCNII